MSLSFNFVIENGFKKIIGEGGFGTCYLAEYQNRKIAVKKTKCNEQNIREAVLMKTLTKTPHLNIIECFFVDYLKEGRFTNIYIGMPLAQSDLLQFLMTSAWTSYDPESVIHLFAQLIAPLEALHKASWYHGDVKPANYLISRQGYLLLTDLGTAEVHDAEGFATNNGIGTPGYQHYDLLDDKPAHIKYDIFAACITFSCVLTSMRPYPVIDEYSAPLQKENKPFHEEDEYTGEFVKQIPKRYVPSDYMQLCVDLIGTPSTFDEAWPLMVLCFDPLTFHYSREIQKLIVSGSTRPIFPVDIEIEDDSLIQEKQDCFVLQVAA